MCFAKEFTNGLVVFALAIQAAQANPPTTTTLSLSPAGSVEAGTVLTLTASVISNGTTAVPHGLVYFCNAAAAHCLDAAILGQGQLTTAGSAQIKLRLGTGAHSIKAVFHGTSAFAASSSNDTSLTVVGRYPSATAASALNSSGIYALTGSVTAIGAAAATGSVSFLDANHGNVSLGSAGLNPQAASNGITASPTVLPSVFFGFSAGAGDFNGDGLLDIAIPQYSFGPITVLLGNGDGTFTPKTSTGQGVAFGTDTHAVDINGDGILDLVVAGADTTVYIFLGSGDGTFTTRLPVGSAEYSAVVSADFNRDGIPDLATSGEGPLTVLLGKGDGTFSKTTSPAVSTFGGTAVVADFNGDGTPDMAVANSTDPTLTILIGNGDGKFTIKTPTAAGISPTSLQTGDFNGDGIIDLVWSNLDPTHGNNIVQILLGNGDGTFTTASSLPVPSFGTLLVGDFNGDGLTDVMWENTNVLQLLAGNGDGTLHLLSSLTLPLQANSHYEYLNGDFNGDGVSDMANAQIGDFTPGGLVNVFFSNLTSAASITKTLDFGSYAILGSYSGDSLYTPSSSPPLLLSVPPATPVFGPSAGTYQWTQNVTLTDSTAGASIYYTLDGTTPSSASIRYSAPIAVSWGNTINAIAILNGAPSATASATYTIYRPLPAPSFSLPSGTYSAPQTITLTVDPSYCATALCLIYYTQNGGTPNTGSTPYTGPITITHPGATTIRAIGTSYHFTQSPVSTATYTLP